MNAFIESKQNELIGFTLQDRDVPHNWGLLIRKLYLSKSLQSDCFLSYRFYFKNLKKHNLYKDFWQMPDIFFIFLYSESVITNSTSLSCGMNYIWKRVECKLNGKRDNKLRFIMLQPKESFLKQLPTKLCALENTIMMMHYYAMNNAGGLGFRCVDKPFLMDGLVSHLKYKTIMNLVYIKEVDLPCLLLPEDSAIMLELQDNFLNLCNSAFTNQTYIFPSLLNIKNFQQTGNVGGGAQGSCFALQPTRRTILPIGASMENKIFVGKKLRKNPTQSQSSSSISSGSESLNSRQTLFNEAANLCVLYSIRNANVIKPHTFKKRENDCNVLMLYDLEGDVGDLIATMEYIEGTDLMKAPVELIDPSTKFFIAIKLAEAVNVLHENGYAHYDLHCSNIRLEKESFNPIILDIGWLQIIDNMNRSNDIKCYGKALERLYGKIEINRSIPNVVKHFLQCSTKKTFHLTYKKMSDVLSALSSIADGITLERKFLDFRCFCKNCTTLFNSHDYYEATEGALDPEYISGPLKQEALNYLKNQRASLYDAENRFAKEQTSRSENQKAIIRNLFQNLAF